MSKVEQNVMFKNCKEKYYLECLWNGLEFIYEQIHELEQRQRQELCKRSSGEVYGLIFHETCGMPEHHMIINYFVWYACSLFAFLKLFSKAYSLGDDWKEIFPDEEIWRHKVAAHTAYTDPRRDNKYTQEISIFMSPNWKDDVYFVGADIEYGPDGASRTDWVWSVTKTHEKLAKYISEKADLSLPQRPKRCLGDR